MPRPPGSSLTVLRTDDEIRAAFWSHVQIGGPDECWPFVGQTYGSVAVFVYKKKYRVPARRQAWALTHGELPEGRNALVSCGTKNCVNPQHLYIKDEDWVKPYPPDPSERNINYDDVLDMQREWRSRFTSKADRIDRWGELRKVPTRMILVNVDGEERKEVATVRFMARRYHITRALAYKLLRKGYDKHKQRLPWWLWRFPETEEEENEWPESKWKERQMEGAEYEYDEIDESEDERQQRLDSENLRPSEFQAKWGETLDEWRERIGETYYDDRRIRRNV